MTKKKTVGLSPKAPAAGAGALLAPAIARLIALAFGIETSEELEAAVLLMLSGAGGVAGAVLARPGNVVTDREDPLER